MKIAVIALAGVSSRFNENETKPVLKGIYTIYDYTKTLLYSILKKCNGCGKVILVGGYQYKKLEQYISTCENDFPFQIQLVYNPHYHDFGTGYTLKLGLEQCLTGECTQIIFIEGDLFFDEGSFEKVKKSEKNVATFNNKPIYSNKAVIAYVNKDKKIKYTFSTSHSLVEIKEPFYEIYNSGQIWKFVNMGRVERLLVELPEKKWEGTNLIFIEKYFDEVEEAEREILYIDLWENCNTRAEYLKYAEQL